MSRPYKGGLDYFQHDTKLEDNIKVLESLYEKDGYVFYFKLLEKIYYEDDQELDISIPEIKSVIVKDMFLDEKKFNDIMDTALKIGLFDKEKYKQGLITSHGIKRRAEIVLKSRLKMRAWREAHRESTSKNRKEDAKIKSPFLHVRYDKITQKWEGVDDAVLSVLKKLYPAVELEKQIEAAGRWIYGHDKQYKDMKRFLCNWMDNVVNERFQRQGNGERGAQVKVHPITDKDVKGVRSW